MKKFQKIMLGIMRISFIIISVIGFIGLLSWLGFSLYMVIAYDLPFEDRLFLAHIEIIPLGLLVMGSISYIVTDNKLEKIKA